MNQSKKTIFIRFDIIKFVCSVFGPLVIMVILLNRVEDHSISKFLAGLFLIFFTIFVLVYLFSGREIIIDRLSKKILKFSVKILGVPVSSQPLNIEISEVVMIPSITKGYNFYYLNYSVYGGSDFQKQSINNKANTNNCTQIISASFHFKGREAKMREIASWLSVPASVYWWDELTVRKREGFDKDTFDFIVSKNEGELNAPFIIPKYIKKYEKGTLNKGRLIVKQEEKI